MNRPIVVLGTVLGCAVLGVLLGSTATENAINGGLIGGTGGVLLSVLVLASLDSIRRLSGSSILLVAGLVFMFLGERMLAAGTARMVVSGLGFLVFVGSVVLRGLVMSRSDGRLKAAHQLALLSSGAVFVGLLMYSATLESVVTTLFDTDEGQTRWKGSIGALWPILVLCGTLPVAAIDRVISLHPRMIPPKIVKQASLQALSASLAIALVFPVNYIASQNEWEKDVAYFRTTKAGAATIGAVSTLTEPMEIFLFYPAGSDVARELEPYFDTLVAASGGMLTVERRDQALDPELAEEVKIRDNGYIMVRSGDSSEKFALTDDFDKAKRKLRKLDENVQKAVLRVARGTRQGYFVVGHGEANFRERDNQLRKLNLFKKVLESQNMKFGNLGATEGLANGVPSDADLLIIAAPEKPLLADEIEAISAYLDEGGQLLVMVDPGGDLMPELMAKLGVKIGNAPLAHATSHLRQSRGPTDRVLLVSNRYGSHKAVRTLSKTGTTSPLMIPTVVSVEKDESSSAKVNTLVRTMPDTWEDVNANRAKDGDEPGKVFDVAVASEGPELDGGEPGWRAVVVGDVNWAADPLIQHSQANQIFAVDAVRWMLGEEALIGETNNEEDVKIQHTRDEDWAWFYLTVIGMPLMVFGLGLIRVRMRRKQ